MLLIVQIPFKEDHNLLGPLLNETQKAGQNQFVSLDVDKMLAANNLLSPALSGNLSPNIMGRTAKFAVSNQQKNKKVNGTGGKANESQCSVGDQGQGTSSSTKLGQMSKFCTLAYEEPSNQLPYSAEDTESHTVVNDLSHRGQKDRIKKEMVTPG